MLGGGDFHLSNVDEAKGTIIKPAEEVRLAEEVGDEDIGLEVKCDQFDI